MASRNQARPPATNSADDHAARLGTSIKRLPHGGAPSQAGYHSYRRAARSAHGGAGGEASYDISACAAPTPRHPSGAQESSRLPEVPNLTAGMAY